MGVQFKVSAVGGGFIWKLEATPIVWRVKPL
jgi:hypothetical protein